MSWFKVDDGMLDHPKWKRAIRSGGDAALHLWLALGTWCSRHLTDGVIPADMLDEIAGPRGKRTRQRALDALIAERLLVRHIDGSMLLHDYLHYNPSRAEVQAERDRWAQRKRIQRDGENVPGGLPRESRGSPAVPSRPPPVPGLTLSTPPAVEPDFTEPPTHTRVPGDWRPAEAFYGEAAMAGVTRAGLDESVTYWRGRKLGGEWFTIEDFFRGKFTQIRKRQETEAFKRAGAATLELWQPEPKAEDYRRKHGIGDDDFARLVAAQRLEDAAGERSLQERHRIFGQRLARFCRERDQRRSA